MKLRERKKAATRQAVQATALELFEERGYAATTVDLISERAEISPASFFRYFGSKEGVLFGDEREAVDAMVACVAARADKGSTVAALVEPMVAFAEMNDDYSPEAKRRMRVIMHTKELELRSMRVRLLWERAVAMQLARESGEAIPQLRHELAAVHAVSCYVTALRQWPRHARCSIAELTRQAFDVTIECRATDARLSASDTLP